ncbi:MAG TPA: hypothetical protein DEE98_06900 [Elusimicrobia bacterium]|nr:MAG: hypothetical protein A2278_01290 [Elusimicrobia bacterium RIFOXYA12_FULL_49_49]OGS09846.1 MAG: hypothetical protein A2386_07410 [Elusimicrobia bacterium RIFOXYB1_FULL_48_9]OGS09899.1 MAG: hypothetical protein A2204_07080 [Elusimicrobia bacterium RIFOXYA1_FULL_47_7]OGS15474.1 MAG: hypothetical protein A2251_03025 [Elusimicrobia bacterium RIFOXYA2_FULL_47_53]OGS26969.1 MAG: hypothetical protein A2339_04540 [Elusimicrobia bacterium RIFOXYB12_FULL_50_12]OGS30914.1 MAG: hypothetical protein
MSKIAAEIKNSVVEFSEKVIFLGMPVLYFLISVAFYLRTYDSAQIKITLIQMGGTALLATWLIKIVEEDGWDFFKKNAIIVLPLFAFLVSGVISYFRSPFPYASGNELVRRVIYIGIALLVVKEFDSEEKLKKLFNWLFAAAFVATIYGVIQFLDYRFFPSPPEPGLDPFIWRQAFGSRIFSTFGNPNFFGDFLVVMSPITLAMYMKTRKFHFILLWLLIAFNTIYTYSKGAWLGFAAGLLIFVFLMVGFFIHAQKAKVQRILFAMLLGTILLVGGGMFHQMKGRPDSSSFRIFTWLSTIEMIKTNPVLGTGIGSFYVTYPAWRRPQIFFIEGRHNTETDHPEDEYLEVAYDEGLVGLGIFLWLLAVFLMVGFKNLQVFSKQTTDKTKADLRPYYQLGIFTAISAQLIHNFVCVSLRFVSSGVFLWLLIGLIGALNIHYRQGARENSEPSKPLLPSGFKKLLQGGVAALALYLMWVFYGYFNADVKHNLAIFYSKQGQWIPALESYSNVAKQNPSFIMAHYFMGNVYNDRWASGDAERSIEKYKDVWKLAPNYVQSHHQAGLIYLKWGEDEKRFADQARAQGNANAAREHEKKKLELWDKAMKEFEKYRTIDPIFPLNYYRMAWIFMQLGRQDKAEQMYKDHLEFPEKLKSYPHNAWVEDWAVRRAGEYSETCVNLGNMKFMAGNMDEAKKYYEKAVALSPDSLNAIKNLAVLLGRQGQIQQATELWQKARKLSPNDPDVQRVFQGR